MVDGVRVETFDDMKRSVYGFLRELFAENEPWRPKVDGLSLPSLPNAAREALLRCSSMKRKSLKPYLIAVGVRRQDQMA